MREGKGRKKRKKEKWRLYLDFVYEIFINIKGG